MKKSNKKTGKKKDEKLEEIKRQQQQLSAEEKLLNIDSFTKKSDEFAREEARKRKERQVIKSWFVNLSEQQIDFLFSNIIEKYDPKFKKAWFYLLADLYKVDRKVMDRYLKPEFVRLFIINFIYARFPRRVLQRLRGKNRLAYKQGKSNIKLFQHLTPEVSQELTKVVNQARELMEECVNNGQGIKEFSELYCKRHKVWFQLPLQF